jgi:hypothetical protein
MKKAPPRPLPAFLAPLALPLLLALTVPSGGQTAGPPDDFPMRTFFSVRSAQPDGTIPAVLREQFEKDDGSPLKSVPIDLDGDGREEKFVLCGVPTAAGGYQWLVFDPARGVGRGIVIGAIIFVGRLADGGYPRLETYWKQGGDMSVVSRYTYARGRYARSGTRALTLWETSEFFRAKPPLDLERELAEFEIKEPRWWRDVPQPCPLWP